MTSIMRSPAPPPRQRRVPFTHVLEWLREGIGLHGGPTPGELDTDAVYGVIDVVQGGWFARPGPAGTLAQGFHYSKRSIAPLAAADRKELIAASTKFGALVLGLSLVRVAGSGPFNLVVDQIIDGSTHPVLIKRTVAVGDTVAWSEFGVPYLVLQPNTSLSWLAPATSAGETIDLLVTYLRYPAGAKPI